MENISHTDFFENLKFPYAQTSIALPPGLHTSGPEFGRFFADYVRDMHETGERWPSVYHEPIFLHGFMNSLILDGIGYNPRDNVLSNLSTLSPELRKNQYRFYEDEVFILDILGFVPANDVMSIITNTIGLSVFQLRNNRELSRIGGAFQQYKVCEEKIKSEKNMYITESLQNILYNWIHDDIQNLKTKICNIWTSGQEKSSYDLRKNAGVFFKITENTHNYELPIASLGNPLKGKLDQDALSPKIAEVFIKYRQSSHAEIRDLFEYIESLSTKHPKFLEDPYWAQWIHEDFLRKHNDFPTDPLCVPESLRDFVNRRDYIFDKH